MATFLSHYGTVRRLGALIDMQTTKRAFRIGPKWVAGLMVLWGLAMIVPAALPH